MKNFRKLSIISGILLIATLACNLTGGLDPVGSLQTMIPAEAQTMVASMIPPEVTALAGLAGLTSNDCQNDLYPVVLGASWMYAMTGPLSDTFTRSITDLTEAGFTDQDVFSSGTTRTGQWTCDSGNLTSLDPGSGSADTASVQTTGLDGNFQTTSMEGVTLPADLSTGSSWTQDFTLEGDQNLNGQIIPTKNVTSYSCTAAGEESVNVSAGTFTAMRVECQTQIDITITMAGLEIPTSISTTTTSWYASEVGWVKSESMMGDGSTISIELTAYNIP